MMATPTDTMAPLIRYHNVTVGYDRHPAVHHLSGSIYEGDLLAVVGPNGAGKSSLLKATVGLLTPLDGRIERQVAAREVAYLPQLAEIDRSFPISVLDLILLGAWHGSGAFGAVPASARRRGPAALAAVGLTGFERRPIGSLSAGQFQRVLFARLMLQEARLILLDEPFAAVDAATSADLIRILLGWHAQGRTVVTVLHDLDQVRRHFPDTLLMARTVVAWGPTPEALAPDALARAGAMAEHWRNNANVCGVRAA